MDVDDDVVVERVTKVGKGKRGRPVGVGAGGAGGAGGARAGAVGAGGDEEGLAPAPAVKRRGGVVKKTTAEPGPLDVTDKAWIFARPAPACSAMVPPKCDGKAGKWTLSSSDDAVHTARWAVISAAVVGGRAGYMAGATTAAGGGSGAHIITVYVGNGDVADEHRAVLSVVRAAGVGETLYFKHERADTARFYSRAGSTDVSVRDGQEPVSAGGAAVAAAAAGGAAPVATNPKPVAKPATTVAVPAPASAPTPAPAEEEGLDALDWDDPALLAAIDAAPPRVRMDAATFVMAVAPDWPLPVAAIGNELADVACGLEIRDARALTVVHGDARGTEHAAALEAAARGFTVIAEAANWTIEGKGAGPARNRRVMAAHKPTALLVFAANEAAARAAPSTNAWMSAARAAGVTVRIIPAVPDGGAGAGAGAGGGGGGFAGGAVVKPPPAPAPPAQALGVVSDDELAACLAGDDDMVAGLVAAAAETASMATMATAATRHRYVPTTFKGLMDPDTARIENPSFHAGFTRGPLPPKKTEEDDPADPVDEWGEPLPEEEGEQEAEDIPHGGAGAGVEPQGETGAATIARIAGALGTDAATLARTREPFSPDEVALLTAHPRPRAEWLVDLEYYRRFVMLTQADADTLIEAAQGNHNYKTKTTAPFTVGTGLQTLALKGVRGFVVGGVVRIEGAGYFGVAAIDGAGNTLQVLNLGATGNARPGTVIPVGTRVVDATWAFGRTNAVSASQFGSAAGLSPYQTPAAVVTARGVKYGLLEEKLWDMFSGNDATQWGNKHEPHARESFVAWFHDVWLKQRYAKAGKVAVAPGGIPAVVLEFGLIAFPPTPWMRVSPDGIAIFLDADGVVRVALVEYKCPFYLVDVPDHPYAKYPKNTPPQYLAQIQGIMGFLRKHPALWRRALVRRMREELAIAEQGTSAAAAVSDPPVTAQTKSTEDEGGADTDEEDEGDEEEKEEEVPRRIDVLLAACGLVAPRPEGTPCEPEDTTRDKAGQAAAYVRVLLAALEDTDGSKAEVAPGQCFFDVWQPRQLWVTLHDFDAAYFDGSLFPTLQAWFFGRFLPAATHKYNGRLAFGETTPHVAVAGDALTDDQLDATAVVCAAMREAAYPAWKPANVAARLAALAHDEDPCAATAAFAAAVDTKGLSKLEGLRRSMSAALKAATEDEWAEIVEAATLLLRTPSAGACASADTWRVDSLAWSIEHSELWLPDRKEDEDTVQQVVREWMAADPLRAVAAIFDT